MRLIGAIGRAALCVLKYAMFTVWGLAALCILFYAAISVAVSFADDHSLGDASAINGRGDEVTAQTERDSAAGFRSKTVIRLKPAHHWFATSLVTAESNHYLVGFKWRGDDKLVLVLDFGCTPHMTAPVRRVGPIRIVYRFDRSVILPDHGYGSFSRDGPRKPCK